MTTKRYLGDYIKFEDTDTEPETPAADTADSPKLGPGDTVHVLGTITISTGEFHGANLTWGSQFCLTDDVIRANSDRQGRCAIIDLIDDPKGQTKKWGKVLFGRGPFPANLPPVEPGSPEEGYERARRLEAARGIANPAEAAAERKRIANVFGVEQASKTIGIFQ